ALGLAVYDVATGLKWHDATLPAGAIESQMDAVAAALEAVRQKRQRPQDVHTVCILGTRNADLPRSYDHLAPTVAWLLERHVLDSRTIAVLERKRLDWMNKEKNLPVQESFKDLLASVVTLEVQVARSGNGIQASAFLHDSRGQELAKLRADSKTGA